MRGERPLPVGPAQARPRLAMGNAATAKKGGEIESGECGVAIAASRVWARLGATRQAGPRAFAVGAEPVSGVTAKQDAGSRWLGPLSLWGNPAQERGEEYGGSGGAGTVSPGSCGESRGGGSSLKLPPNPLSGLCRSRSKGIWPLPSPLICGLPEFPAWLTQPF